MTKQYTYNGNFDEQILFQEIVSEYPHWIIRDGPRVISLIAIIYDGNLLVLELPDDADDNKILEIVTLHDPSAHTPVDYQTIQEARRAFMSVPDWATWTPQQAEDYVNGAIFSGQTAQEIETWIDQNVNNINTAKTALKLIARNMITTRLILSKIAMLLMYIRNIVAKR